ncbi:MAG: DNA-processing protein DprA [Lysobacterales bacterium]
MENSSQRPVSSDLSTWLRLIRAFAGSASTGVDALREAGGAQQLFNASASELARYGISASVAKAIKDDDRSHQAGDDAWLDLPNCHLVTCMDDRYPPQLNDIADPPLALFCRGNPQLLWLPQVAIVGTRKPTAGGRRHARMFAQTLASQGLVVTSGLALGVDGEAHQGALDAGGMTIAVAATGLDRIYPARHVQLAGEIVYQGLIVSEFPPGWEPRKRSFPQRNRLISGLSLGVLVIEASVQSGSLITARLAGEQGRDVYALPGSIDNPLARGCHRLIKQGARLVEDGADLMAEVGPRAQAVAASRRRVLIAPQRERSSKTTPPDHDFRYDKDYKTLYDAVGFDELPVDLLVDATGLTAASVSSMLLILELGGLVQVGPGGGYCRTGEGWQ